MEIPDERNDTHGIAPKRGGMIYSIKLHGKEILYLDEATFRDNTQKVRGGIPVLFPNAGAFASDKFPLLKQNGFARDMEWLSNPQEPQVVLRSDENTRKIFPYDFMLSLEYGISREGVFSMDQQVSNSSDVPMPISMGLHPYFKVRRDEKKDIKFNFEGGNEIESQVEVWSTGGTVSVANPNTPLEITIPELGTLVLNYSKEYKRILVWSEEGKDFVCIEPVMRDPGGLVNDPQMLNPGEIYTATITIELKD